MPKQKAVQSSTNKDVLREKLERLTMEEHHAEQDLRKIQERISSMEKGN